jgi:hypothetical protein
MDKPFESIVAEIAILREHIARFRRLAEERRAADQPLIADKLTEVASDFEVKAAKLERLLGGDRPATS